ncbi:methyl-accepting chemotaxis protein [Desulfobacterales bacterium HSG2]|nr:methyl-accepting chemotaxis protein [Desulfobacterales bacterium HSG2]
MAVAFIMTRMIATPIYRCIDIAQAIAIGETDFDIKVTGRDEAGQLLAAMKKMTSNFRDTVRMAEQIAEGDLTAKVKILSDRDILGRSLARMVRRLREIISDVKTSANSVRLMADEVKSSAERLASVSQQMSMSAEEMSQGASEQAASAEEASASMEEMASNIRQNAENAAQTEKIALKSAEDARGGGEAVTDTVKAMREITDKILVVKDIAAQTDILALNAAIEAAGADGDLRGKRFAVVANETRDLAERCKNVAGEIDRLSRFGVKVAERAGDMFSKIVPDVRRTAELVQEISAASNEQNLGADQINNSIQQLDQVIQQNANSSEELASTAEEMASTSESMVGNSQEMISQTERLRSAIGYFRMGDDVSPTNRQAVLGADNRYFLPEEIEKIRAVIARAEAEGKTGEGNRSERKSTICMNEKGEKDGNWSDEFEGF